MEQLESVPFDVFLILFGFIAVVVLSGAAFLRWGVRRQTMSGYLVAGMIGASVGFTLATAPYLYSSLEHCLKPIFLRSYHYHWPPPWWPESIPLFGPFSGFSIGSPTGFALGVYLWHRRQRHKNRAAMRPASGR